MDLGADFFLRKPASLDELQRAIAASATGARRAPAASLDGMDVLEQYSASLVRKLEEKNVQLTSAIGQLTLRNTALETAADAVLITDAHGTILWVNQAFTAVTGYSKEEAIGNTPRILKSGKHDQPFFRELWKTIRSGAVWRGEVTNRRKDGRLCYEEHTITPVRGPHGDITHFVGVQHDVTERKQGEDALRDAHAQLRQLLEHSPAVLYALRVEGHQVVPRFGSENVSQLLGFTVPETMIPGWWNERLHPDDRDLAEASISETLTQGVSRTEYRLRHKNGSYLWVDDNRRLVRDSHGEPFELVGVWTDITERRLALDNLRVSEQRFSDMLRNLQLVSMMLDRDARITYCNDHLLRLTGWQRHELLGRNWFEVFVPPERRGEFELAFATLLADAPGAAHHENEILTRAGHRHLIHWNNTALRSGSGEVVGTASIGEDITERIALQNQMLRAQRLESLGTLAGGIAHDLNNLFMPILMGATLIKRFDSSERTQRAITNIEHCVKRGTDLVKQVLLFARGVEGSKVAVDLAGVIAEVDAIAVSTFPKNISFLTAVGGVPSLMGDPTQLAQVLLNLCVNARDAMPDGGHISVSATATDLNADVISELGGSQPGHYAVLEVADDGAGMPPEIIDRIFEPFFTTKPVGKGTGLGLSTARGIVRSHGGFVTVHSEIGKGTTFKVYLPAPADPDTTTPLRESPHAEIAPGNGQCILVVDDETAILEITRQTLEAGGYETLTARNGSLALDLYTQNRSSMALVLTDMMMPVLDGATLINTLRRLDPNVRILAASGLDEAFHDSHAIEGGMPHLLVKPFTVDRLLRSVAESLRP